MDKSQIQQLILQNTDTKEPITRQKIWIKCGKPRRNDFLDIIRESIKENWIKSTKEGIIRVEFSKKDFISFERDSVLDWVEETRKLIAKKHKPLFKKTKKGVYYLTKSAQEDLYRYFSECDFHTLNTHNRNFLAHRLKLLSPAEFKRNNTEIAKLFDFMFHGIINDHKSFKKQIINHYMMALHQTKFVV